MMVVFSSQDGCLLHALRHTGQLQMVSLVFVSLFLLNIFVLAYFLKYYGMR